MISGSACFLVSFLFPSKSFVFILNAQSELFGIKPAGPDPPQIDGEPGFGDAALSRFGGTTRETLNGKHTAYFNAALAPSLRIRSHKV
jgi:hypothetical protein